MLITRVSMRIGSSLAKAYGMALGGAVALVASTLAGFQPVLLVILGIVWWVTHKLTFDCTLLDEDQDAGVGLLQESGLDPSALADQGPPPAVEDPAEMDASLLPAECRQEDGKRDDDDARRPNAPGVWLVYFTLASLPLFGLGQWFVPAVEEERRGGLFVYFLAYISSGMGLLLATSFLNLRRYLRQRKLKMPAAMTATWLSTGAIVIIGLTVLAAALPLPGTGWSVVRGSTHGSVQPPRVASGRAQGWRRQGRGGRAARKTIPTPSSKPRVKEKAAARAARAMPRAAPRAANASKSGAAGKQGSPRQDQSGDQKGQDDRADNKSDRESRMPTRTTSEDDQNGRRNKNDDQSVSRRTKTRATRRIRRQSCRPLPFQAPSWLRGLFIVVGAVALIFGLFRYGPVLLDALRALIASLFGGFGSRSRRNGRKRPRPSRASRHRRPGRFASFADPFASGLAQNFSPNDLIIYSFEALEAWAFEHDLARSPHETPTEFVHRLGQARSDLRQDATRLAGYLRHDRLRPERLQSGGAAAAPPVLAGPSGPAVVNLHRSWAPIAFRTLGRGRSRWPALRLYEPQAFGEHVEDAAQDPRIIGPKRAPELTLGAPVVEEDPPYLEVDAKWARLELLVAVVNRTQDQRAAGERHAQLIACADRSARGGATAHQLAKGVREPRGHQSDVVVRRQPCIEECRHQLSRARMPGQYGI